MLQARQVVIIPALQEMPYKWLLHYNFTIFIWIFSSKSPGGGGYVKTKCMLHAVAVITIQNIRGDVIMQE